MELDEVTLAITSGLVVVVSRGVERSIACRKAFGD
jgi:hypothetical protein